MRFYQIKTLIEAVELDPNFERELANAAKSANTPEEKQNFIDSVKQVTANIEDKVKALVTKYKGKQATTDEDIEEAMPGGEPDANADAQSLFRFARQTIRNAVDKVTRYVPNLPKEEIANLKREAWNEFKATYGRGEADGREKEFRDDMAFIKEYEDVIRKVAAKTTGTLIALEEHYKKQAKEAEKDTARDGHPGVEIPNVSAPQQTQVEKAVEDTLRSVFSSPAFKAETREEKIATRKLLTAFLNDCVEGILKLGPLLDKGQGNIIEAFKKTKYKKLTPFFNDLLGKVPSGSGAGSWGPAELALSVVGTPVNKAEKGDLNIGGSRKIELKASRNPKSGGRVNTPAIGTGKSGKGNYDRAFLPFAEAIGLPIKSGKVLFNKKVKATKKNPEGLSPTKIKYTSFGPTLINEVLNPLIEKSGIDRSKVVEFVKEVALAPVVDDHRDDGMHSFEAGDVVTSEGTINDKAFVAEYLNMVMGFYVKTDGVAEVLVINPVTGNYHVVDARKMDTLHDKIASEDIQLSTTYLDFTDTQSKASPQLGTA